MNSFNKKVSTLLGIAVIVGFSIISFGGAFAYQYFAVQKENIQTQVQSEKQNQQQQKQNQQHDYKNNQTQIDQTGCKTDSDCKNGALCMTAGPIIANQAVHRICVPPGQAVPL